MAKRNITKHFRKQWYKRIKGMTDAQGHQYVQEGRFEDDLEKTMAQAEYVATTSIGSNPLARYYISNDIVIVVSEDDTSYVTTWRVKYDLPGDLDRTFRKEFVKEIHKLQEEIKEETAQINQANEELQAQLDEAYAFVREREREISEYQEYIKGMEATIKGSSGHLVEKRIKLTTHVKQLLNAKELWQSFNAD